MTTTIELDLVPFDSLDSESKAKVAAADIRHFGDEVYVTAEFIEENKLKLKE